MKNKPPKTNKQPISLPFKLIEAFHKTLELLQIHSNHYLLREIDGEEGNPPPLLAVL
jgi:hypothetical protein